MPGIITHNKIFTNSINHLQKGKNKDVYSKSIEALFSSDSFVKAGLFGAIGPNIFDYIPFFNNNFNNKNKISYELHSSKSEKFLKTILDIITSYKDLNTEWSSTQRAYFYGLISHFISDSIFHPFVYYWSGFSSSKSKNDLSFFREQHLLFEYNMDIFFSQRPDEGTSNRLNYQMNEMFPLAGRGGFKRIEPSIKIILSKAIGEAYPYLDKKINLLNNHGIKSVFLFFIDVIPILIKLTYRIKKSRRRKLIKIINYIKRKNFFYSDFLVPYPSSNKINTHILNLHKERWFHPTGASGLHYESAEDLLFVASAKTADIWKKFEEFFYSDRKDISGIENELKINSITGVFGKSYSDMQIQNPVHLRF